MDKQGDANILVSQRAITGSLLVTVASALFWSYLLCGFFSPLSHDLQNGFSLWLFLEVFCGLLAFALTQLLLRKAPGIYGKARLIITVAVSFALSLPLLLSLLLRTFAVELSNFVLLGTWVAWGVSNGLFFPLLGSAWSIVGQILANRRSLLKLACAVFIAAAVLCSAAFFLPQTALCALTVSSCVLAFAMFYWILSYLPEIKDKGAEPFLDKFNPQSSSSRIIPLIICATITISIGYSIQVYGLHTTLFLSAGAALCGGLLSFIDVHFTKLPFYAATLERVFFPVASFCFLALTIFAEPVCLIAIFVLISLSVIYAIAHWGLLLAVAQRFAFASPYHFSLGLVMPSVGLTVGWTIVSGFVLFGSLYIDIKILFFAWTVFYILVVSIAPYASDPTFEIDLFHPDFTDSMDSQRRDKWRQKCVIICENAGLSPREQEVFLLLARGRNAEYIQLKLYISRNTVNTHKYRIYRKLNIESQQEILDLVEKTTIA